MDADRRTYAAALLERSRAHDATQADRLDRFRNLEPETAELLGVLVRALRPHAMLELGTSNGYSTIWLADAAAATGARLVSVDLDAERVRLARAHLTDAGLDGAAELRVEDAAATLRRSTDGEWGFVFLDAERPAYAGYWPELRRVLAPAGLLVVDNVLSHAGEVAELRALVDGDPAFVSSVVPIGAGALLVARAS
jgi:predicted O-methyltransferase YrrM